MTPYHKSIILAVAALIFLICVGHLGVAQAAERPLIGIADFFPEVPMLMPADPVERSYLGLGKGKTFTLSRVKAPLVLVEILNVHCPSCQEQAPVYNKLFEHIEKTPNTRGKIKMIGIAAGNSEKEVKAFREQYKIPFPIVPDPKWIVHRAIGSSRTPYSIYVRQDDSGGRGVVAGKHLGFDPDYKSLHYALSRYMTVSIAAIRGPEPKEEVKKAVVVEPIMTEVELAKRMKDVLSNLGGEVKGFKKINLENTRAIYTGLVGEKGSANRFFAEAVSRPSVCDICHDVHFIYVFDISGKVLGFTPLQLTKYDNEPWNEDDVTKMRKRVLGRYIYKPMPFNREVDAVSSATMTSAIIFDSLSQGEELLKNLKKIGLIDD